jgi:hypothetical protein
MGQPSSTLRREKKKSARKLAYWRDAKTAKSHADKQSAAKESA